MSRPDPEKARRLVAEGNEILKQAIYSPLPQRPFTEEDHVAREQAIERFTQAIAADPRCIEAWLDRGTERYFLDQVAAARWDMRAALALEPREPRLYLSLAMPFEGAEKREILARGMTVAGVKSPYYEFLRRDLVKTDWYEGDYERELQELERWRTELEPGSRFQSFVLWELAQTYAALGHEDRAEELYREALPLEEGSRRGIVITLVLRTRMHRDDFAGGLAVLGELGAELAEDDRCVWDAVLHVLDADTEPTGGARLKEALPSAETLAAPRGPLGGTSYNRFLAGVLYAAAGRSSDAEQLLAAYFRECEASVHEWAVTQRWEIARAKLILAGLRPSDSR